MSTKNDGGSAFPIKGYCIDADGALCGEVIVNAGMTLRDYFAAKAMQGICASGPSPEWTDMRIAVECYHMAAAMLAARHKS